MASPRVLMVLVPALAIVGGLAAWWLRGSASVEPTASFEPMSGDEGSGVDPGLVEGSLAGADKAGPAGGGLARLALRREPIPENGAPVGWVTGRVIWPDGRPAVFGRVVLRPAELVTVGLPRVVGERIEHPMWLATVGVNGEFTIDVPSYEDFSLVAEPAVLLLPSGEKVADTQAPTAKYVCSAPSEPFHLTHGVKPKPITLRLRRPGRIEIRVVDEFARPVTQARVSIGWGPNLAPDGKGTYARGDLVPQRFDVEVSSPSCDTVTTAVDVLEDATATLVVEVRCGVRISGTVVDPAGKPVPEAHVRVVGPGTTDLQDEHKVLQIGTCDAAGRFELGRLPEGPLRLHADADGFDSLDEFTEVSGAAENVRVRGQWLGRARLRLETSDGSPLPHSVEVNVGIPGEPHPFEGMADVDNGVILVSEFSGDDEQLVVDVPGFAPVVRTVRIAPGKEVDLGTAKLDAGQDVIGVVVTPTGTPIANASVRAAGNRASDYTARDGTFVLHRLPAGPVDLVVAAEGYLTLSDMEVVVGGPKKEPLRLVLRRACVVRAKVERPDGKPAVGERLAVVPGLDDAEHRLNPEQRAFRTEDDGTFVVSLPPGPYRIQADVGGQWTTLGEITLADGEHRDLSLRMPTR